LPTVVRAVKSTIMGRTLRIAEGGFVYHGLNRGNGRRAFLNKPADVAAFERVLAEAQAEVPMRILAYCLLPNHWHLLLWPHQGPDLSRFVGWVTLTHTQRWHAHYHHVGSGHLYQGRFKSFPVQQDDHFYTVCRYIERNGLRANLVSGRAEQWPWCSLWYRLNGQGESLLSAWPLPCPDNWAELVNEAQTEAELQALRLSVKRGRPFGHEGWVEATAERFRLGQTLRPRGRPAKKKRDEAATAEKGTHFL
jgi:putative transposase